MSKVNNVRLDQGPIYVETDRKKYKIKATSYPDSILNEFKVIQRTDGRWCIQLAEGRVLHWIETTNDVPVTVWPPDFTMQSWHFKEEAEGFMNWLKRRWSQDPNITADTMEKITVLVDVSNVKPRQTASGN